MDESNASIGKFVAPFLIAFVGWAVLFFALDYGILALRGLSLVFAE